MNILNKSLFFLIMSFIVISISCSYSGTKESLQIYEKEYMVNNIKDIKEDNVVIVGRFVLDPPLKKSDVVIVRDPNTPAKFNNELYRNIIFMGVDYQLPPRGYTWDPRKCEVDKIPKHFITKLLGKTFYFQIPKKSFYIVGGNAAKNLIPYTMGEYYLFPARYEVQILPSDKAIYIGTLYYKRDEFGSMDAKVKDEYAKAKKQFIKKLGRKIKLKKRLMIPVD